MLANGCIMISFSLNLISSLTKVRGWKGSMNLSPCTSVVLQYTKLAVQCLYLDYFVHDTHMAALFDGEYVPIPLLSTMLAEGLVHA